MPARGKAVKAKPCSVKDRCTMQQAASEMTRENPDPEPLPLGKGIPLVRKNVRRILSFTYALRFGSPDIGEGDNQL